MDEQEPRAGADECAQLREKRRHFGQRGLNQIAARQSEQLGRPAPTCTTFDGMRGSDLVK
jgi:hypothetical protein